MHACRATIPPRLPATPARGRAVRSLLSCPVGGKEWVQLPDPGCHHSLEGATAIEVSTLHNEPL